MDLDSIDPDFKEELNIEQYHVDNNSFRTPVSLGAYDNLVHIDVETLIDNKPAYTLLMSGLQQIVFIDLSDVYKFLKIKDQPGFNPIDIKKIADIVCDYLGDDGQYHEAVWTNFDEIVAGVIGAQLGNSEEEALMGQPFGNAMEVVTSIADLIRNYLINADFPLIENQSVYTVTGFKNGIVGLQLRTYEQIMNEYCGEGGDEEEENTLGGF